MRQNIDIDDFDEDFEEYRCLARRYENDWSKMVTEETGIQMSRIILNLINQLVLRDVEPSIVRNIASDLFDRFNIEYTPQVEGFIARYYNIRMNIKCIADEYQHQFGR